MQRKRDADEMPAYRYAILLTLLFAAPFTAQAAPGAWRCGNTYTDHPCEGGEPVAMDDRRNGGQQRDADTAARRAQSAADRMANERLQLERSAARRQAVLIAKPPEAKAPKTIGEQKSKVRRKKQHSASDDFTAQGPGTGARKKAAKAASAKET